jgi:Flp pilus assembly protein protease CpaA
MSPSRPPDSVLPPRPPRGRNPYVSPISAGPLPANLALAILALTLTVSVLTDLRDRRILNAVTYPAFLSIAACIAWLGGTSLLAHALLGALLCATPLALAMSRGWIGAGDVKLISLAGLVAGAAAGWPFALTLLLDTAIAGGLQALLWIAIARARSQQSPRHVPYGVAIAAGTAWAFLAATPFI